MINRTRLHSIQRRVCPNPEAVTLRVRKATDGAGFDDYALAKAYQREPGAALDMGEPVVTTADTRRWQVWRETLDAASAPDPKIEDIIRDASGVNWIIKSLNYKLLRECINLMCQRA